MAGDEEGSAGGRRARPSRQEILRDLDELIGECRLFGAELDPSILKKSGSGARFLVSEVPSRARMLRLWTRLFGDAISPRELFDALAARTHDFTHGENVLLFGRGRLIYDAQILQAAEPVGELTLSFSSRRDLGRGLLAFLRGERHRVVHIEHIRLDTQGSGYASALFPRYERLFRELGFHQLRLKASLSLGKYYWAQEGFDFLDRAEVEKRREGLRELIRERGLSVREAELAPLNHAYNFAFFRKDLRIPVFRDAEGYHSLVRDERFTEEVALPLGKAFLLTSAPWEGYKTIYTNTPRTTGLVTSPRYLDHRVRAGHPESPGRLRKILAAVDREGLGRSLVFLEPYAPDPEFLETVHAADHLARFRASVEAGDKVFATVDCSIGPGSWDTALLAAGGVMAGIDAVMNERVRNVFCAVRPPGHHAGRGSAMGFCFINNVAVGVAYARAFHGVRKVFVLDWDVHHGNGTQEIFEEDPLTYYCSIHEHPSFCFPGTGRRLDTGKGAGAGFTCNVPLMPHAGDREMIEAFEREVVPRIERFEPELILVSAGFDAHAKDPLADLEVTEESFAHMTRRVCELAERFCGGRVVSVLEGGYDPRALASSVVAHLRELQGRSLRCTSEKE